MKEKKTEIIGIRISEETRKALNLMIVKGPWENYSQILRNALNNFKQFSDAQKETQEHTQDHDCKPQ